MGIEFGNIAMMSVLWCEKHAGAYPTIARGGRGGADMLT
jgi:hypothetical protein